jgi:hypothetical protein
MRRVESGARRSGSASDEAAREPRSAASRDYVRVDSGVNDVHEWALWRPAEALFEVRSRRQRRRLARLRGRRRDRRPSRAVWLSRRGQTAPAWSPELPAGATRVRGRTGAGGGRRRRSLILTAAAQPLPHCAVDVPYVPPSRFLRFFRASATVRPAIEARHLNDMFST